MNEQDVRAVLATAMAYDNRKPGEANIAAWMEAADRGRWTYEDAIEAVHQHYATSTQFLMPGHITAVVRARLQLPAPAREVARLEAARPAEEETRSRLSALIREKFAMPGARRERRPLRKSAEDVAARERARQELRARGPEVLPDDVVG